MTNETPFEVNDAMKQLDRERIAHQQPTPHHLKVKKYNVWPKTGSIHIDGQYSPHPDRGIHTFIKLIKADNDVFSRAQRRFCRLAPAQSNTDSSTPNSITLDIGT